MIPLTGAAGFVMAPRGLPGRRGIEMPICYYDGKLPRVGIELKHDNQPLDKGVPTFIPSMN